MNITYLKRFKKTINNNLSKYSLEYFIKNTLTNIIFDKGNIYNSPTFKEFNHNFRRFHNNH